MTANTIVKEIHETLFEVHGTHTEQKNLIYIGYINVSQITHRWVFHPATLFDEFGIDCLSTITNKIEELNK